MCALNPFARFSSVIPCLSVCFSGLYKLYSAAIIRQMQILMLFFQQQAGIRRAMGLLFFLHNYHIYKLDPIIIGFAGVSHATRSLGILCLVCCIGKPS